MQIKFAPDEIERMTAVANELGLTLSDYLREFIQPPIPEHDLMQMDLETLRQMWFQNHRIFQAQRGDPAPHGPATPASLWGPVMSARIENVLIARGYAPALELMKIEDHDRYLAGPGGGTE